MSIFLLDKFVLSLIIGLVNNPVSLFKTTLIGWIITYLYYGSFKTKKYNKRR